MSTILCKESSQNGKRMKHSSEFSFIFFFFRKINNSVVLFYTEKKKSFSQAQILCSLHTYDLIMHLSKEEPYLYFIGIAFPHP